MYDLSLKTAETLECTSVPLAALALQSKTDGSEKPGADDKIHSLTCFSIGEDLQRTSGLALPMEI